MKVYAGMDPRMPLTEVGKYARRVERLGYDGLHVPETVHDSFAVALLAAERTETLIVRTGVSLAFVRSPTLTAYAAWDLARFSSGRFELGLGTQIRQNIEDRFGMPWGEPVQRLREYILVLRELFGAFQTGAKPDFRGSHYRITRMQPYFNPGPNPEIAAPRIYLGGVNPGICQLAGELADGFITHPTNSNPEYLQRVCRPQLLAGAQRAGRTLDDLELVCGTQVITGVSAQALHDERERQRRLFAFLYSTPAYRRTLELYGWPELAGQLQAMIRAEQWDDLPRLISDEVLDALVPTATFEQLPAILTERFGQLADAVMLSPPPDPSGDEQVQAAITALRRET